MTPDRVKDEACCVEERRMYVVDVLRHTLGPIHTRNPPPPLSAWPVAKTSEEIASLKYTQVMKICLATTQ